jgi:hypothetical protein
VTTTDVVVNVLVWVIYFVALGFDFFLVTASVAEVTTWN